MANSRCGILSALCGQQAAGCELHAPQCACDPTVDKDVCVQGKALFCTNGYWTFGFDGPGMPGPDAGQVLTVEPLVKEMSVAW